MGKKTFNGKRLFVVLTIVCIILIIGYSTKKQPPSIKEAGQNNADTSKQNDEIKHKILAFNLEGLTEKGAKKWDVKGESAEAISENEVKLDNIVAKAYGEDGEATITADTGVYNKVHNNVILEKNVKATIDSQKGFGNSFPDFTGQAVDSVKAGTEASKEEPKKDKKVSAEKKKTIITCDGDVQFDYERNVAYFSKNVKVNTADGDIKADKITVNLDVATKRLKEIIAEGNVQIVRADNITYSEKATYIEAEKKIVLTGKPKIVLTQEGGAEGDFLGGLSGGTTTGK